MGRKGAHAARRPGLRRPQTPIAKKNIPQRCGLFWIPACSTAWPACPAVSSPGPPPGRGRRSSIATRAPPQRARPALYKQISPTNRGRADRAIWPKRTADCRIYGSESKRRAERRKTNFMILRLAIRQFAVRQDHPPAASWRDRLVPRRQEPEAVAAQTFSDPADSAGTIQPSQADGAESAPTSAPTSPGPTDGAGCAQFALAKKYRPKRYAWSELLKRVFAVDALKCDLCGGRMRILCAVNPPEAIRKILDCLGMPIRAPPTAPALIEDWGCDDINDAPVYSESYA